MRKLNSFTFISLDGFYKDENEDIAWHSHGEEESEFSKENLKSGNTLIFGRITHQMMAQFWPTAMASELFPEVARMMNEADKIVFSKKLKKANWKNSTFMNGDPVEEIRKLKKSSGPNLTILGSGTILRQLNQANLIDEYKVMIDPVLLGKGTLLFAGTDQKIQLILKGCRSFKSGTVLLDYHKK